LIGFSCDGTFLIHEIHSSVLWGKILGDRIGLSVGAIAYLRKSSKNQSDRILPRLTTLIQPIHALPLVVELQVGNQNWV